MPSCNGGVRGRLYRSSFCMQAEARAPAHPVRHKRPSVAVQTPPNAHTPQLGCSGGLNGFSDTPFRRVFGLQCFRCYCPPRGGTMTAAHPVFTRCLVNESFFSPAAQHRRGELPTQHRAPQATHFVFRLLMCSAFIAFAFLDISHKVSNLICILSWSKI